MNNNINNINECENFSSVDMVAGLRSFVSGRVPWRRHPTLGQRRNEKPSRNSTDQCPKITREISAKLEREKLSSPGNMNNNINKIMGVKIFLRWTWWQGSGPLSQGGFRGGGTRPWAKGGSVPKSFNRKPKTRNRKRH